MRSAAKRMTSAIVSPKDCSRDGTKPFQGYSKAKKHLDEAAGVSDWTLHDLRRTAVSGMARPGPEIQYAGCPAAASASALRSPEADRQLSATTAHSASRLRTNPLRG